MKRSPPKRTRLETFQRITGVLSAVALLASTGAGLADSDDRSPLVAGTLILFTLLFTAWMIARSINQRRRLSILAEVLSHANDEPHDGGRDHLP
jgi:hypothetical protein